MEEKGIGALTSIYRDGGYHLLHPDWHEADSLWKTNHIFDFIGNTHPFPQTICEIGCGAGEILALLQHRLNDSTYFVGLEISPQAFNIASAKANARLEFRHGGLELIHDQVFDIVLMIDVFEHVEDYISFLKEVRTHGTRFIFHIPLDLSVQSVLRAKPLQRKRKNLGHLHYFTKETALATLSHCGFNTLKWKYTASYVDLQQKSKSARLLRIPRKLLFNMYKDLTARIIGGFSLLVLAE